jgi:hypothetical protein
MNQIEVNSLKLKGTESGLYRFYIYELTVVNQPIPLEKLNHIANEIQKILTTGLSKDKDDKFFPHDPKNIS